MIFVESAGLTHTGKCRRENEDALLLDDDLKLYVVADGVGGHQGGKVASELVVKSMLGSMMNSSNSSNEGDVLPPDPTLSDAANRLALSIHFANQEVFQKAQEIKACQGMGSTLSAVCFTDETMIAANVGDSPIYLIRNEAIELLSVPHTVLAERALAVPEEAGQMENTLKHVLTRAMGVEQTVTADFCEIQIFPGDAVVVCSDGLSGKLDPDEISEIVTHMNPDMACRSLIDLANDRGGDDNITVILLMLNKKKKEIKTRLMEFASRVLGHTKNSIPG